MNDIVRRDPRAEWIARNRLHPLHAAMQSAQGGEVRWMGPHGVIRKNPHAVGFLGPNGIRRIDRSGGQQGSGVRRASVAQEAQLPLHVVEQPAFLVAVVPDMVGGRLSSHDKDLLGLARKLAGNDGAVLAVVFGEHKESAFDSAGVDRLLHLSGGEYDGYAPEQRILALRNLENQLAPRHWLFPDSRNGGGELGRRLAAALGERPAGRVWQVEALLDAMPGVVFFVKDERARYVLVNRTLARRCGVKEKTELLGRSADEVFPSSLGPLYAEQDRRVLRGGATLENQLELHLYPGRQPGWCLTHKQALRDADGAIIGMAGISHDLPAAQSAHPAYGRLAAVDAHIREHYDQPLSLADLTAIAGLSVAQLERHCKRIFQLTPRQMIHKARLGAASQLLAGDAPITEIALRCGYTDHSAFSRQFKALTGLSPSQYRETHRQPRKA